MLNIVFFFYLSLIPILLFWASGSGRSRQRRALPHRHVGKRTASGSTIKRRSHNSTPTRPVEAEAARATAQRLLQPEYYLVEELNAADSDACITAPLLIGEAQQGQSLRLLQAA